MEFEKLIKERFSVRKFKPEHLPKSAVDKILSAASLAPTGCNNQPQRILVLNTDGAIERLRPCTKCHFGAPTAFVVCHDTRESWRRVYDGALSSPVDAAIVATHMMLAAHNEGIGCCWVMHFNPIALREAFSVPEGVEPLAILVMGYPAEDAKPLDMHYACRPTEDLVVYDHF